MSASAKIPLSGLSRGELEALAERLLAENAALRQAIAELRAEVATLKGVKGRPKVRPSGMEKGTGPEPAETGRGRGVKAPKIGRLTIHEERVIAGDCQEFRVRAMTMGRKEPSHGTPQSPGYPRRVARPAS